MRKKLLFLTFAGLITIGAQSQLHVNGATFYIGSGASVVVQGDVTSNVDILGPGTLSLKGTAAQNLDMGGFTINPTLEIDNANGVSLLSNAREANNLLFTNGKLKLTNFNFSLTTTGTHSGAATGKYAETAGTGQFIKEVNADGNYTLPVGTATNYNPLQYQVTGASFASAYVGAKAVNGGHPNKHPRTTDFLNEYWTLNLSGITGGSINTIGTYVDPTDVTGSEPNLRSMTWNGSSWAMHSLQDNAINTVTAPMAGTTGDLYAMNRFLLATPKVFLQGVYNPATGLMSDLLRNSGAYSVGIYPASNLLPTTDPYRSAPYSATFPHVNNSNPEIISSSVLADQADPANNIVDWVFVELRNTNASPGNTVLQTRSALLRRNGTIVDVDGTSPVYFANADAGNFAIAVRHRNHLGLSSDPTAAPVALNLVGNEFNFATAADASLFGTTAAYTTASHPSLGTVNLLWGGNANYNLNVRFSSGGNDKDYIFINTLFSNPFGSLGPIYHESDVNMNRLVRYSGGGNDKDFILLTVLGNNTFGSRIQALPN